jgi:hypothetical protein
MNQKLLVTNAKGLHVRTTLKAGSISSNHGLRVRTSLEAG